MEEFKMSFSLRILLPAIAGIATASAASAQTFNSIYAGNGVTWSMESSLVLGQGNIHNIDLGTGPIWRTTPTMFNYSGGSGQITFSGNGLLTNFSGSDTRYLNAWGGGSTSIDFSTQQRFFGMRWGWLDNSNVLSFYNGSNLLYSVTGAQAVAASGNHQFGSYSTAFNFAETGYTRVVMTGSGGGFEHWNHTFSDQTVAVAPIPLGGVGGIVALLGMFALRRGHGGHLPQRLLAFASGGRRQQVQRFA